MAKLKIELGKKIAINALKKYFLKDGNKESEENEIMEACLSQMSKINLKKIFLKIQKEKLNQIIIRSALEDMPEDKRKFIEMKYKQKFSCVKIAMNLGVSYAQLNIWQSDILQFIENMLFYKLDIKEIYSQRKMLSMMYVLDEQISYLETNCSEIVNRDCLNVLVEKRYKYQQAYMQLSKYIESEELSTVVKVIKARSKLGSVSVSTIANEVGCSSGRVSKILKEYVENLKNLDIYS